jgi:hypothetical protein
VAPPRDGSYLMSSWSRSIDDAALGVREGAVSRGISAREPLRNYFVQVAIVFLARLRKRRSTEK